MQRQFNVTIFSIKRFEHTLHVIPHLSSGSEHQAKNLRILVRFYTIHVENSDTQAFIRGFLFFGIWLLKVFCLRVCEVHRRFALNCDTYSQSWIIGVLMVACIFLACIEERKQKFLLTL